MYKNKNSKFNLSVNEIKLIKSKRKVRKCYALTFYLSFKRTKISPT